MLVFPQLATGASGQFPITRTRSKRTLMNSLADGRVVRYLDETGDVTWDIDLRDMSPAERGAIEELFVEAEGRLRTFTFCDPADNLLRQSETLTGSAWTADALLVLSRAAGDPLGTQRAWRLANSGQGEQGLAQRLPVPASFTFCFSVWIKGTGGLQLSFGSVAGAFAATSTWTRISVSGSSSGPEGPMDFRLKLSSAAIVDVFGFQVEAQPGASGYRATNERGGIYPNARFGSDELRVTAEGLERERVRLRITAVVGS